MTAETLRERLKNQVVKGGKKLPTLDACERLATVLCALRFLASSATPEDRARYKDINEAMRRFISLPADLLMPDPEIITARIFAGCGPEKTDKIANSLAQRLMVWRCGSYELRLVQR